MTQQNSLWSRSPAVAFVDDGERVVVLGLAKPGQRPNLLAGDAGVAWRLLDQPRSFSELEAAAAARWGVPLDPAALLPQLEAAGLCVRC